MSADAGWRWTARGLSRAGSIALVALSTGAALGYVVSHEPPPHDGHGSVAAPPSPLRAERTLLAPLHEGSTLLGFDVAEILPIGADGVLHVACRRAHSSVSIEVTLAPPGDGGPSASQPPLAPITLAGRYAVTYALNNASPAEGERLAGAFAAILKANAGVAPPPGLEPSSPAPP